MVIRLSSAYFFEMLLIIRKFARNKNKRSMIKIFATEKVKEIDKYTIQNLPIEPIALVEEAVTAFVNEFKSQYSKARRVIVFAGQGNNGADALGIARQLLYESYKVETYLFNPTDSLSPECAENKRQLLSIENAKFTEIRGGNNFAPPILTSRDVVIDGLFGSGLNRPLEGGFVGLVKYINASPAEVVAVDIPSGLFGEDNRENDPTCIIQAKQTYTFNFPKLSFFMPENEKYVGEWKILPLNMHPQAIADTPASYFLLTEEDITGVGGRKPGKDGGCPVGSQGLFAERSRFADGSCAEVWRRDSSDRVARSYGRGRHARRCLYASAGCHGVCSGRHRSGIRATDRDGGGFG